MEQYWNRLTRSNWIEVNLDAITDNLGLLRRMVGPGVQIMPAVKANAYGHGILESCRALEAAGADLLGVGSVEEGIALREYGLGLPLLIFAGNTVSESADIYLRYRLIPTIMYTEQARAISQAAGAGEPHPVFVKVETGRGRLGMNAEDAPAAIAEMSRMPGVRVAGVYTHLCDTNWEGNDYTLWQNQRFCAMQRAIDKAGIEIPFYQIANTAASIAMPGIRHTGICPGQAIWGYSPLEKRPEHPAVRPALRGWKTRVILVKETAGGKFGPGFGSLRLETPKRIGVIPAGLSDGVDHRQANGGAVLVRGKRVPVASAISLEHTVLDLTDFPEVQPGDQAVLLGEQGDERIGIEELCTRWDRNLSEFLSGMNPTLPRVYFSGGRAVSIAHGTRVERL